MGSERGLLHDHFVKNATCLPDVTPIVIVHVFPDFGTGIVWGASLRAHHSTLGNAGNIHVAEFHDAIFSQEDIGTLYVSVADSEIVEGLETSDDLNKEVPHLFLREICVGLLVVVYQHQKIATVRIFHDQAEAIC